MWKNVIAFVLHSKKIFGCLFVASRSSPASEWNKEKPPNTPLRFTLSPCTIISQANQLISW
jgi:hypothetical protein